MYVGNYENWAFAQPAKDWRVSSYKSVPDTLQGLDKLNIVANVKEGLADSWAVVYFWFFLDIKTSGRNLLELPSLTTEEMSPVSPRD